VTSAHPGPWRLAKPILDNKAAFKRLYPGAAYLGDVGDPAHMKGSGDHTWWSTGSVFGVNPLYGVVYAQDLGGGGGFDLVKFSRWLLDNVRAGRYPEVKYVITRLPGNLGYKGGVYFGLFDRRYSWRTQASSGHTTHIHISYMPGAHNATSTIVADFKAGRWSNVPDAKYKQWTMAPARPAYPLGAYSRSTFDLLPSVAYPPLAKGYGGADNPAQRGAVIALQRYAVTDCKTGMIPRSELDAGEIGSGTIAWCRHVSERLAGNPWTTDPVVNARAFGASIGARGSWNG
jgi:hypothetical protein